MCGVWPMFWICLVVCVGERTAADSNICVVSDPCFGSVWWCVWEREQQQTALYVWCLTHVLDLSGGVCKRENSSRRHYMCGVWPMFWICLVVCVRERTAADSIICVMSDPCSGSVWWCVWEREQQQTALYVWCVTHVLDLSSGVCGRENSSRQQYMCGVWPMFWICLVVCVGERTAADGIICVMSDPCSGSVWWCVWEREQQQTTLYVWCLTHVLDLSGGVCERENSSRRHYMCDVWPMFWICLVVCVGERTAADGIICVVSDPCFGSVWWCVWEREQQQTALYVWCLTHVLDLSGGVCGRENSSRRHYMCDVWPMFWICLVVCVGERTAADGIICVVCDPCSGSVWWCVWEREQQQTAIYVWCLTHVLDLSGGVCGRENSSRRHYMCDVWPMFWICLVVCVWERTAADGIICVVSDQCLFACSGFVCLRQAVSRRITFPQASVFGSTTRWPSYRWVSHGHRTVSPLTLQYSSPHMTCMLHLSPHSALYTWSPPPHNRGVWYDWGMLCLVLSGRLPHTIALFCMSVAVFGFIWPPPPHHCIVWHEWVRLCLV